MIEITSKNNQVYKLLKKLLTKKYRDKTGMYLIEGENLLNEAVLSSNTVIESVVCRKDSVGIIENIADKIKSNIFVADEAVFKDLAMTETSQGVIAAVKKPEISADEILFNCSKDSNFVILDRLQDPGNIGTIIRTADAAGYGLVIAMKGTADIFSPKTVRSAAGSLFRVPVLFLNTEEELIRFIKAAGKKLAAATPVGSRYYYEEDMSRNIAFIVGNEGNGVSENLMGKSELKIKIPMRGTIESLNASVAAAIIMYEAVRIKHDA